MNKTLYFFPLFLFAIVFLSGCSRQLETGLTEQDAHQIVVVLRENGISAETVMESGQKKDGSSWQVSVRGQNDAVIRAWKILRENGLPREKVKGLDDVFANSGMIPKRRILEASAIVSSAWRSLFISFKIWLEPDSAPKKIIAQPAWRIASQVASE